MRWATQYGGGVWKIQADAVTGQFVATIAADGTAGFRHRNMINIKRILILVDVAPIPLERSTFRSGVLYGGYWLGPEHPGSEEDAGTQARHARSRPAHHWRRGGQ